MFLSSSIHGYTMYLDGAAYKAEELHQLIQAGRDSNVMSNPIHQTTKKQYTWHDKVPRHIIIIYVKVEGSLGHWRNCPASLQCWGYSFRPQNNVRTSVNFSIMTDHKCTWSAVVTNQHAWIQSPFCSGAWHIWLHGCGAAKCMSSSQPTSFSLPPLFSPASYIYASQPGFESSSEN